MSKSGENYVRVAVRRNGVRSLHGLPCFEPHRSHPVGSCQHKTFLPGTVVIIHSKGRTNALFHTCADLLFQKIVSSGKFLVWIQLTLCIFSVPKQTFFCLLKCFGSANLFETQVHPQLSWACRCCRCCCCCCGRRRRQAARPPPPGTRRSMTRPCCSASGTRLRCARTTATSCPSCSTSGQATTPCSQSTRTCSHFKPKCAHTESTEPEEGLRSLPTPTTNFLRQNWRHIVFQVRILNLPVWPPFSATSRNSNLEPLGFCASDPGFTEILQLNVNTQTTKTQQINLKTQNMLNGYLLFCSQCSNTLLVQCSAWFVSGPRRSTRRCARHLR